MSRTCLGFVVMSVCLVVSPAASAGQEPTRGKPVDEVIVTQSDSGVEMRGTLLDLSADTLAMLVDGRRVEIPLDHVLRVDARHDPVKDGAIIGAAVMGGLAALACPYTDSGAGCAVAIAFETGLGALVGAGIDALHKGRTPIYIKPAKSGAALQLTFRF
jgi:hypothetical protein